jgi:hypothetical protein
MPSQRALSGESEGRGLERWRWVLVAVFGYGTAVHLLQLVTSGGHPYRGNPWWIATFFVSLTALDPIVAGGLARRRRWAVWSALLVLALDAAANGYAVYVVIPASGLTAGRLGHGVITLLAIAVVLTARPLDRLFAACARASDSL